jgi:hypothetical protein
VNRGQARTIELAALYGLPFIVGLYYIAAVQAIAYSPDGAFRAYLAAGDLRAGLPGSGLAGSSPAPLWVFFLAAADGLGLDLLLSSKILSLIFCCFALLGMYLFTSTLIGDRIAGLLATLVVALDPWLLQAGPSGTSAGLALALSVGSLFFIHRGDFALGSLFAGLTSIVFWQAGALLPLIVAVIVRSHGLSPAAFRRIAGALVVYAAALLPWVLAAFLGDRPLLPGFVSGLDGLPLPAGRWAVLITGAGVGLLAAISPPVRHDGVRYPVTSRLPYWGWTAWLALCAWLWDPWFLILMIPVFFALMADGLSHLVASRAGSAIQYLAAIVAVSAVLVAVQQTLFLLSTRPAIAASLERGEETALASAWLRGSLRPSQSVEAEPQWQVSYLLGRRVDPIGRRSGSSPDVVLLADSALAGYREVYRPLPAPEGGGGPRLAVFLKQRDIKE